MSEQQKKLKEISQSRLDKLLDLYSLNVNYQSDLMCDSDH